jgi:hypothetical protein
VPMGKAAVQTSKMFVSSFSLPWLRAVSSSRVSFYHSLSPVDPSISPKCGVARRWWWWWVYGTQGREGISNRVWLSGPVRGRRGASWSARHHENDCPHACKFSALLLLSRLWRAELARQVASMEIRPFSPGWLATARVATDLRQAQRRRVPPASQWEGADAQALPRGARFPAPALALG